MTSARNTTDRVGITSVGHALPAQVVSSTDLQSQIESASGLRLPRDVLFNVTGIVSRRIVSEGEYASTLAIRAGNEALRRIGFAPTDIDLLLFASATRDVVEPATAHIVQAELGTNAHCLDVTNACNSFVNGIDLARAMIRSGRAYRALVVTGETPSITMRMEVASMQHLVDHFAGYTFGDAGAAVVVEPVEAGGILLTQTSTHSDYWSVGGVFGGGSRHVRDLDQMYFTGAGSEIKQVFEKIGLGIVADTLKEAQIDWADIDRVLVHQVTTRYVKRFVEVTGAPVEKLVHTVADHGNMASATLGVQLAKVWDELSSGSLVLIVGLGGGVSIMTMLWQKS